jgi:hypothetical protein
MATISGGLADTHTHTHTQTHITYPVGKKPTIVVSFKFFSFEAISFESFKFLKEIMYR